MKKIVSILTLIAILALSLVILTGCANENKDQAEKKNTKSNAEVAGTYVGKYTKFVGDPDSAKEEEEFSLELKEDGTGKHNRDGMSFNVTWSLDGEKFKMSETFVGDPIEYTGTLKDKNLDIFNGDTENALTYEYVYEKE